MNEILKQRLVGALVLIALGVLFWPLIFVETDRPNIDRTPEVQPMPQLAEVDIPAPEPLADVESVREADALRAESETAQESPGLPAPEVPAQEDATPESPVLDERGIPVAWVLQVATVSTREKAEKLTEDLVAEGYKAYHRTTRKDGKQLFRVFVGPVFEREKLAGVKRDIDKRLDVSAIIARYVP